MKRLFLCLTTIALSLGMVGCSMPLIRDGGNDMQISEETFNSIINALDNKDSEALKAMFSENAKEEAVNLDNRIKSVIQFYQGKMISKVGSPSSEENIDGKNKKLTVKGDYTVTTDKDIYFLFFIVKTNTADAKDNGLYAVKLLKTSDKLFAGAACAGIYIPEMIKPEDYLASIFNIIESGNLKYVQSSFSKNAIGKAVDFDDNVTKANDLFQGHMTSSKEIETSVENEGDNVVTKGYYEVTTSDLETEEIVGTYLVYFVHKRNETDPDEDGLYTLEVAKKINESTELSRSDTAGIIVS